MLKNMIPEFELEPPEARAAALCGMCGGEMYRGERYYVWDNAWVCADCMKTLIDAMGTDGVAELIGCDAGMVGDGS